MPGLPACARANLIAASMPSLPELAKKALVRPTARKRAKPFSEFACKPGDVVLQHRRPGFVELVLERRDDAGMIVSDVVDAIT